MRLPVPLSTSVARVLKNKKYWLRIPLCGCVVAGILAAGHWASGAGITLIWDASTANPTDGPQDGAGTWDTSTANWWNGTSDQVWQNSTAGTPVTAQFGGGTAASDRTVTINGSFQVAALNFAAIPGSISTTNPAYVLKGGTINLDANGTINIASGSSSSNPLIIINSTLTGSNITIRKSNGTSEELVALGGANNLTGTLTIASGNGSLFIRSTGSGVLNSLDTVVVQSGNTLNLQGDGATYTPNFVVGGPGTGTRGAIRFENNMTLTGNITLSDNTVLNFQNASAGAANVLFTKGIGQQGGSFSFTKTGTGKLTLQGASTYTGATIIAPAGSGVDPGELVLDFADSLVNDNLLYNGVTPGTEGALTLKGNTLRTQDASIAKLTLVGADFAENSQTFGGLSVTGPTAIQLSSGLAGSMDLNLGAITRTGVGTTLAIIAPEAGAITTTTNVGTLLGTWTAYTSPEGFTTWAGSDATGVLNSFTGDLTYTAGLDFNQPTKNLAITSQTTGDVTQVQSTTKINTITMKGTTADRVVTVGAGNILDLGQTGGIQLVHGARSLVIGAPGNAGTLTAGSAANAELFLSNFDSLNTITVNSVIADNGVGAVNLVLNGSGTTILTGNNTYTGSTMVWGGLLEIQSNNALGATSGSTSVGAGATLGLMNGITVAENLALSGTGVGGTGALRSMTGNNTYTGVITLNTGGTSITADAGSSLTLFHSSASTAVITGTQNVVFSGAGTINVNSIIGTSSGAVTKSGSGLLILNAANTYSGATTVSGGIMRITNAGALGATTTGTTVNAGGTLELTNNISVGAEALALNGTGVGTLGAVHSVGNNTFGGKITLQSNASINSDSGTLTLTNASAISGAFAVTLGGTGGFILNEGVSTTTGLTKDGTGSLILSAGTAYTPNVMTLLGGSITGTGTLTAANYVVQDGNISVTMANGTASSGLTKTGSGTVTLTGANTYTGNTAVADGLLVLDYSGGKTILPTTDTVSLNGGRLEVHGSGSPTAISLGALTTFNATGFSTLTVDSNVALTMSSYSRQSGTAMLIDLSAAGSSLAFTNKPDVAVNGTILGAPGGNAAVVMKDSNGRYDFAAVGAGNTVTRLNATTALPTSGGNSAVGYVLPANGNTVTLGASETVGSLRIDTTGGSGTLNLNGQTLTLNLLAFLMDGDHDYTITNSGTSGGLYGLNAVFIYQFGTGKLTLDAQITGPQTFFMGTGLVDWTGSAGNAGTNYILGATVRLSGTGLTLASGVTGNGAGILNIGNNGILELNSGDFTRSLGSVVFYSGGGGFSAYGTDRIVNLGGAGGTLTWGGTNFLASGSKLILGSPYANAVVDFQNSLDLNGGNQTVEVQSTNAKGIGGKISGNITGANGTFSKIGQGILNLAGTNTYAGATFVKAGTLQVTGSINGSASVNVASGAELMLSGSGAVTAGTLSLANNAKLSLEVGTLTATEISLTGSASLTGSITLALTLTSDPLDGTTFTLIDGGAGLLGYDAGARFVVNGVSLDDGATFSVTSGSFSQNFVIDYDGGADGHDVTVRAVPEPSSLVSLCAALGFTAGLTRLRRRARPSHDIYS